MATSSCACAWVQRVVRLKARRRGCHSVMEEVEAAVDISQIVVGVAHLTLQHTSASICLNENWDSDVQRDMEMMLNHVVPEDMPYRHTVEGKDDMPAHVKAAFVGSSLSIPIQNGRFLLGTWQSLWLCEHRDRASSRNLIVTVHGSTQPPSK